MIKAKRLIFTFFILFILLAIPVTVYSFINVINVPLLSASLIIQPAHRDSYMQGGANSDTNNGSATRLYVKITDPVGDASRTIILNFDFTSLPGGATINSAYLNLYYYDGGSVDPNGETLEVLRCTRTDWVEAQVTWDDYKTSSAWTSPGGDTTDTNKATVVMPASFSWVQWDVTAQAQYAQANTSEIIHMILAWASGTTYAVAAQFYSTDEATQTTLRPKLTIHYTP